jgi:hypothetical protein
MAELASFHRLLHGIEHFDNYVPLAAIKTCPVWDVELRGDQFRRDIGICQTEESARVQQPANFLDCDLSGFAFA